MKRIATILMAIVVSFPLLAQTETFRVTESGWGVCDWGISQGAPERTVGEMNITNWKKTNGTLTIDFKKNLAVLSVDKKKDAEYTFLTESRPYVSRDGWTYQEFLALSNSGAGCQIWICKHPDGAQRLLIIYPPYQSAGTVVTGSVYGYMLVDNQ